MARDQATGAALMFSGYRERPGLRRIAGVRPQPYRDTFRCQASRR